MKTAIERFEGLPPNAETRVVRAEHSWELSSLTSQGFQITHSWVETGVLELRSSDGSVAQKLGPVRAFLLARPEGSALEAASKVTADAHEARRKAERDEKEARACLEAARKELAELRVKCESSSEREGQFREIARNLEANLSKVRKAIGTERWNEIVGGDS